MGNGEIFTLEDFVKESTDFLNSDSYYELKKECLEFQLESLIFSKSKDDVLKTAIFENGSSDDNINKSKNGIISKISNLWKILIRALKVFLKNVSNVFTNTQGKKIKDLEDNAKKLHKVISDQEDQIEKQTIEYSDKIAKMIIDANNDKMKYNKALSSAINDNVKANIQIKSLHEKIKSLIDNNSKYKEELGKILGIITPIINETMMLRNIPVFVIMIDEYIEKFDNICFNMGSFHDNVKNDTSGNKINSIINKINGVRSEISNALEKKGNWELSLGDIMDMKKYVDVNYDDDNLLPKILDFNKATSDDVKSELYSKYISAMTDLIVVFKKGIGLYIKHTNEAAEIRKWAFDMASKIQDIMFRIDLSKLGNEKYTNKK